MSEKVLMIQHIDSLRFFVFHKDSIRGAIGYEPYTVNRVPVRSPRLPLQTLFTQNQFPFGAVNPSRDPMSGQFNGSVLGIGYSGARGQGSCVSGKCPFVFHSDLYSLTNLNHLQTNSVESESDDGAPNQPQSRWDHLFPPDLRVSDRMVDDQ